MTSPPPSSSPSIGQGAAVDSSAGGSIDASVRRIAADSGDDGEFLRRLAAEMLTDFGSGLIALQSPQHPAPIMLVGHEATAQWIDRDTLRSMLRTAAATPMACDVATTVGTTQALRVELLPTPTRTAVVCVFPVRPADRHDGATSEGATSEGPSLLSSLRRLDQYAAAARGSLRRWYDAAGGHQQPAATAAADLPTPTGAIDLSVASSAAGWAVTGQRRSLRSFHQNLDLYATAYRIANESRRLLGCDRVCVLAPHGGRQRVAAISGVAVVDRRSNTVQLLERLVNQAVVMARPLALPGRDPLPTQIQEPLDDYLDEAGVTHCVVLPLHGPGRRRTNDLNDPVVDDFDPLRDDGDLLGVLVLESFSGVDLAIADPATTAIACEASLAMRNAQELRQVFALPLMRAIGKAFAPGVRGRTLSAVLLAASLLIASLVIRVDHQVIAKGQIQPAARRQVFAAVDGIVKTLRVRDGDWVDAGDPLIEMDNADLTQRIESMSGQLQTATQRLAAIRINRLDPGPSGPARDAAEATRLAMEQRQIESEIQSYQSQFELLKQQQRDLIVRSPIDGRVVAWQLEQRLKDRPVSRGNALLSIVDDNGPWELSLTIPDRDAGPVLESAGPEIALPIRFAMATKPEQTFAASLSSISTAARLNAAGEHVIDATAAVPRDVIDARVHTWSPDAAKIGTDVTARIACDRRSLLASWFSDVIDFTHRHLLIHFR